MSPWVAPWIGVDAYQTQEFDDKSRLFPGFPLHSILDRLSYLHKAPGKGKAALIRGIVSIYEHYSFAEKYDGIHRQERSFHIIHQRSKGLFTTLIGWIYGKGRLTEYPSLPYIQSAFCYLLLKEILFLLIAFSSSLLSKDYCIDDGLCNGFAVRDAEPFNAVASTNELKYGQYYLMSMPFYVLKLGGSLMSTARDLMCALSILTEDGYSFLVVPGGGPMADLVREIDSMYEISEEAAHWMAILAMEQYAYFLADGGRASLTREIRRPEGDQAIEILLPYQVLQKDDLGLVHSWDYTSDSVAALVAHQLKAPFIKVTNVDGVILDGKVVEEVSASSLHGLESCIDQGTLCLLCGRLKGESVWVLNGTDLQRFVSELRNGKGGTVIKGSIDDPKAIEKKG